MTEPAANGWLLHLAGGGHAAIGLLELSYLFPEEPPAYAVPCTPAHTSRVIVWQQRLVPVIDLHARVFEAGAGRTAKMVGIVHSGADPANASAGLGALMLSRAPEQIQVSDDQACDLPEALAPWAPLAVSCFLHPLHGPTPILDVPALLRPPQIHPCRE